MSNHRQIFYASVLTLSLIGCGAPEGDDPAQEEAQVGARSLSPDGNANPCQGTADLIKGGNHHDIAIGDTSNDRLNGESGNDELIPECNCWGSFKCPPTGKRFGYDQPRCGVMTRPQARAACEHACSARCVDSGWTCS